MLSESNRESAGRLAMATLALVAAIACLTWHRDTGLAPERVAVLQEDVAVYRRFSQWSKMLAAAGTLHSAFPENHVYLQQLAEAYGHLRRHKEEAEMWERFLEVAPMPVEACPQIGQAYEKQGLQAAAIGAFERCLKLEPDNPDPQFFLAHALERAGNVEAAAALYEQGAVHAPRYWDLAVGLARMRLRQNRVEEARKAIGPVLAAAPDNVDALLVIGLICRREGDRANARRYLARGSALAAGDADFHTLLGKIAEEDGNLAEAIGHYAAVAKAEPHNSEIAQHLALLRRVQQ